MPKYEDYGLFQDLLSLAMWLQGSFCGVTTQEIMSRFEVSRRTAERMRNAMASLFPGDLIEMRDGRNKSFKLNSKRLKGVALASLAEEEIGAIRAASKLMRKNSMSSQADLLDGLFEKLKSATSLSDAQSQNIEDIMKSEGLALKPAPRIVMDARTVSALREAMMSFRCVLVSYTNSSGESWEYRVIPMGILYGEKNHYLVARFPGKSKKVVRHFILSRISKASILSEDFEEDPDFSLEAHAAQSFGAFQEEPVEVEWLFSPEAAEEASRMVFHPSQETRLNPSGSLKVSFRAGGRLEMAWHLYTWGNKVKVVKPKDFWESLPDEWAGNPFKRKGKMPRKPDCETKKEE